MLLSKGNRRPGFSEEALRGLDDMELRLPPVELYGQVQAEAAGPRPHYWGHRERLRRRFLEGGHGAMPEYELLELLLFNAVERIDVKPLAKALLATFGDLNGVVAASEHRLLQVPGTSPRVYLQLRLVEAFAHRMARAKVMSRSASGRRRLTFVSVVWMLLCVNRAAARLPSSRRSCAGPPPTSTRGSPCSACARASRRS